MADGLVSRVRAAAVKARKGELGELATAFTPKQAPAQYWAGGQRGKKPSEQAAESIRTVARAVKDISRRRGITFEEAGEVLRQTARDVKKARAAVRGLAAGLTKRGATQPLTSEQLVTKLSRPSLGLSPEIARFTAQQEVRHPQTKIKIYPNLREMRRQLLGIRR